MIARGFGARSADFLEWTTFRFWGVVAFALVAFAVYERAASVTYDEIEMFNQQLAQLKMRQQRAAAIQETLQAQLNSLDDPAWIELTLIRELGVIPPNQMQVILHDEGQS